MAAQNPSDAARGAILGLSLGELPVNPPGLSDEQLEAGEGPIPTMESTALALAVLEAYRDGGFDPGFVAEAMLAWQVMGNEAADPTTRRALGLLAGARATPWNAGQRAAMPGDLPTAGALPRAAVVGLVRAPADPRLVGEALAIAAMTHPDQASLGAAVAVATIVSQLVHAPGSSTVRDVLALAAEHTVIVDPPTSNYLRAAANGCPAGAELGATEGLQDLVELLRRNPPLGEWVASLPSANVSPPTAAALGVVMGALAGETGIPHDLRDEAATFNDLERAWAHTVRRAVETTSAAQPVPLVFPPRPNGFEHLNTCSLPLPQGCPSPDIMRSCAGCPVAELQGRWRHDQVGGDDAALEAAARSMAWMFIADTGGVEEVSRQAMTLYCRADIEGNSLAKTVLYGAYKRLHVLYGAEDAMSVLWTRLTNGDVVPRWPDGLPVEGPSVARMLESYLAQYAVPEK